MNRSRLQHLFLLPVCIVGSLCIAIPTSFAASCCKCKTASDASNNICMTIAKDGFDAATQCKDLATLYPTNEALKSLSCESMECGNLKLIPDGGTCSSSVLPEVYGATTATPTETKPSIAPQLEISIPGLSFPSQLPTDGGMIQVPFLAMYIGALYKYLVGICVIAAALMVVYGGFKYILGASFATISTGKQTIQDALIGLVLIFGSYTLLASLNPATVAPQTLNIQAIAQTAFSNPAEEKQRVISAATVPPAEPPIAYPGVGAGVGGAGPAGVGAGVGGETAPAGVGAGVGGGTVVESSTVGETAGYVSTDSAISSKPLPPGTVAQDPDGNYIAQGNCPTDMKAIPESDTYPKGKIKSFCMDTFEAPNGIGKIPLTGFNELEADYYCRDQGKRLCNEDEWLRACLGPKGDMQYSYGKSFLPDVPESKAQNDKKNSLKDNNTITPPDKTYCNNNTLGNGKMWFSFESKIKKKVASARKPEESAFNSANSDRPDVVEYFSFINKMKEGVIEPSGKRPTCVSPEGIFDLAGNAQEIVVSTAGSRMNFDARISSVLKSGNAFAGSDSKPYIWKGYFWLRGGGHGSLPDGTPIYQEPDCFARWGKKHAVGYRTYENTARCCMNLDPNAGN